MGRLKKSLQALQAPQKKQKGKGGAVRSLQGKQNQVKKKSPAPTPAAIPIRNRTLSLFKESDSILLVGEGNFSFARSLCEIFGPKSIIATCYDSQDVLQEKYPESIENIKAILEMDGQVLYGIDATELTKHRPLKSKKFSKIVFNFPHAGKGIKDQDRNIRTNQELCASFFHSAMLFLAPEGEILMTLRAGEPYDTWGVKGLAKSAGLASKTTTVFNPDDFPGYAHRRTIGFDDRVSADANEDILRSKCSTYVFVTTETADNILINSSRKQRDEDSD
ncbi:hypothetical protein HDU67_003915 [Dinochytrium kinnereticum]|nr:hypothetical protein HDU67_003915 [Dinochytrium kinnereticum]